MKDTDRCGDLIKYADLLCTNLHQVRCAVLTSKLASCSDFLLLKNWDFAALWPLACNHSQGQGQSSFVADYRLGILFEWG